MQVSGDVSAALGVDLLIVDEKCLPRLGVVPLRLEPLAHLFPLQAARHQVRQAKERVGEAGAHLVEIGDDHSRVLTGHVHLLQPIAGPFLRDAAGGVERGKGGVQPRVPLELALERERDADQVRGHTGAGGGEEVQFVHVKVEERNPPLVAEKGQHIRGDVAHLAAERDRDRPFRQHAGLERAVKAARDEHGEPLVTDPVGGGGHKIMRLPGNLARAQPHRPDSPVQHTGLAHRVEIDPAADPLHHLVGHAALGLRLRGVEPARRGGEPLKEVEMLQSHPAGVVELFLDEGAPQPGVRFTPEAQVGGGRGVPVHQRQVRQAGLLVNQPGQVIPAQFLAEPRHVFCLRGRLGGHAGAGPRRQALLPGFHLWIALWQIERRIWAWHLVPPTACLSP